ncbi:hypothetical protein CH330_03995 [candidate division WOR-3 bacterium JGI_Cruoil_03_51_56]|uniref:Uncharacterized protein n=1 Tax=candidate division WOR-3 bacterium JGI_Cruoil_03_51_56 TaxID=1973747 RepID=A0A235BUS4_UNCW3|nr:MAG: hypothetical protein CH330_03995 [candidate division WOR-3 bacterium JGI_Cruoil_03_51_56]
MLLPFHLWFYWLLYSRFILLLHLPSDNLLFPLSANQIANALFRLFVQKSVCATGTKKSLFYDRRR